MQNAAPVADNQLVSTGRDTAIEITLTAVDNEPITFELVDSPANGDAQLIGSSAGSGIVRYTPNTGFAGLDTFTFRASDGQEYSALATVQIQVNFEPVASANPITQTVQYGDGINPVMVTAYDEDSPGNVLAIVSTTWSDGVSSYDGLPDQLSLTPVSNNGEALRGEASWTLNQTAQLPNGTYTVTLVVDDGIGVGPRGPLTGDPISIVINEPPTAYGQVISLIQNNVAENDTPGKTVTLVAQDSDLLVYRVVDGPKHGQLIGMPPNLAYVPAVGYYGPDSFTFQADDPWSSSNVATVHVTVRMGEFVVYGDESVALGKEITVLSGSVGVNLASGSTFEKDAELGIGDKVQMLDPASRVVADRIKIKKDATVYNPAYNKIDVDKKGTSVLGMPVTPLAVPVQLLPALPADFTPGAENLEINKDEVRQLAPGTYGELKVKKEATVILTGGLYHFKSWKIEDKATVYVQGPTEIRIAGQVEIKKESMIAPDPTTPGVTAGDIVLYVAGTDDKKGEIKDKPAMAIGDKSTIYAYIVVPNGTLQLGKETSAVGAFIGRWVDVGDKGTMTPNASAIDAIIDIRRTLVLDAIAEAEAAGGKAKEFEKVREELDKAQAELDQNKPLKALEHYQLALNHVNKALGRVKGAEVTDGGEVKEAQEAIDTALEDTVLPDTPSVDPGRQNMEYQILLPFIHR